MVTPLCFNSPPSISPGEYLPSVMAFAHIPPPLAERRAITTPRQRCRKGSPQTATHPQITGLLSFPHFHLFRLYHSPKPRAPPPSLHLDFPIYFCYTSSPLRSPPPHHPPPFSSPTVSVSLCLFYFPSFSFFFSLSFLDMCCSCLKFPVDQKLAPFTLTAFLKMTSQ